MIIITRSNEYIRVREGLGARSGGSVVGSCCGRRQTLESSTQQEPQKISTPPTSGFPQVEENIEKHRLSPGERNPGVGISFWLPTQTLRTARRYQKATGAVSRLFPACFLFLWMASDLPRIFPMAPPRTKNPETENLGAKSSGEFPVGLGIPPSRIKDLTCIRALEFQPLGSWIGRVCCSLNMEREGESDR